AVAQPLRHLGQREADLPHALQLRSIAAHPRSVPRGRPAPPGPSPPGTMAAMKTDWNPLLRGEFQKPYWIELQRFVAEERARTTVYPPPHEVFAALHLTPYAEVKAVILGQDPYHGPNQAHGLCFS